MPDGDNNILISKPGKKSLKHAYENQQLCHICEKEFCTDKDSKKEYKLMMKVRDHCFYTGKYRGAAHSICNLRYKVVKEIPVVFHNGSAYDYHFIIKYLASEFCDHFESLGENTEKYITFSVPIKKVINDENDDNEESKPKEITYKIKFIDSCRFMQDSLSNLVDNLSELKNREIPNETLIERFHNTYQLSDNDFSKFKLLLRKGIYPYEYMDSWKEFEKESLPGKEYFYSELNKEHISDEDYAHAHEVWNTFNIRNLGEYHDLYVQLDTALLADVLESFRDKCFEIYKLDPAYFLTAAGLAWRPCLKKTEVELELLTDNNMLVMFEKGIRGGMCQATYR